MADEITLTTSMSIRKYSSQVALIDRLYSRSMRLDMSGTFGPFPGAVVVPTGGVLIDLSRFSTPGMMVVTALFSDEENYVDIGIYDPQTNISYPLLELVAGMQLPLPLSRNLRQEYASTGTGTGAPTNTLWAKSWTGDAAVSFDGYEK